MKLSNPKPIILLIIALFSLAVLAGCQTGNQSKPQPQQPPNQQAQEPSKQLQEQPPVPVTPKPPQGKEIKVTFAYGDKDKVKLSQSNLTLKVGETLIIEANPPIPPEKKTRFMSTADQNDFNAVMEYDSSESQEQRRVYTAKQPGKGVLKIVPNYGDWDRAAELTVSVEP